MAIIWKPALNGHIPSCERKCARGSCAGLSLFIYRVLGALNNLSFPFETFSSCFLRTLSIISPSKRKKDFISPRIHGLDFQIFGVWYLHIKGKEIKYSKTRLIHLNCRLTLNYSSFSDTYYDEKFDGKMDDGKT